MYLSNKEEKYLAVFLKDCAAVGHGKMRKDVTNIAQSVAKEKGLLRGVRISQGWWHRQHDLTVRRGDNIAHILMTLTQYFSVVE